MKIKGKRKYKNRSKRKYKVTGFTLFELLGVIVIIGILLLIAISGVTTYITTSRKQVVVTAVDSYIKSVVPEVNDLEYRFSDTDVIYAVPIECIPLEEGGENPLGEWLQANDDYWAYVLVQYNPDLSNYTYGFTFKDSNGNGMYPIVYDDMNIKGKDIKTNLNLTKPQVGDGISLYTQITSEENWNNSGFRVSSSTQLKVLEATSDGETGDGKETCTLCQKGDNYEKIEMKKYVPEVSLSLKTKDDKIKIVGSFDNYKNSSKYYEVTAHGLLYIQTAKIGTRTLTVNTSGRTRVNFDDYNEDGSFSYSFKPSSKTTSYAFRAFLVYKDPETGKAITIYSNMTRSSYNYISS